MVEVASERLMCDIPPVVPDVRRHVEQRHSVVGSGRTDVGNVAESVKEWHAQDALTVVIDDGWERVGEDIVRYLVIRMFRLNRKNFHGSVSICWFTGKCLYLPK